jgi:hypothetical protein
VGFIRRQIGSDDDRVPEYLARAIGQCSRRRTPKTIARVVTDYNESAAGFVEIAAVIGKAKAFAEADMQGGTTSGTVILAGMAVARRGTSDDSGEDTAPHLPWRAGHRLSGVIRCHSSLD